MFAAAWKTTKSALFPLVVMHEDNRTYTAMGSAHVRARAQARARAAVPVHRAPGRSSTVSIAANQHPAS